MTAVPDKAFQVALEYHRAGRLRDAEIIYRQILQEDPQNPHALQLLGLIAHQAGRHDAAVELIGRAVALCPDRAEYHSNLGEAYRALGKFEDASRALRRAVELNPELAEGHNNLGNVLRAAGRWDEAAVAYREAIRLRGDFAEAHNNLGLLLQSQGDFAAAAGHHRRAIELDPSLAGAYNSLAHALTGLGQLPEAVRYFQHAIRLSPRASDWYVDLGAVYQRLQQFDAATTCYREAIRLNGRSAIAHNNLGSVLNDQGQYADAVACYRQALEIQPNFAEVHFNLAVALHAQADPLSASAEYEEALRLKPDYHDALVNYARLLDEEQRGDAAQAVRERMAGLTAQAVDESPAETRRPVAIAGDDVVRPSAETAGPVELSLKLAIEKPDQTLAACLQRLKTEPDNGVLHGVLGTALLQVGRGDEALREYHKACQLEPNDPVLNSNYIYACNFQEQHDAQTLFELHRQWAARHAEPLTAFAPPHANDRTPERRLRIGYVSPHFRSHAVNFFMEPVLLSHDHARFEIFCYADAEFEDAVTDRLKAAADHWRDGTDLSDEQLAQMVRDDAIDILVDLAGHIGGNRLLVFARKPAPVQVTYLGYQNTTGMSAMDYRLTDELADPPGLTDRYYTERLVRLPRAFFCYRPPDYAPPITPLPASGQGFITFGSFNHVFKITPRVIDAWLTILQRVQDSRLLILAHRGGYLEKQLHALAGGRGIAASRIELCDRRPPFEYLRLQQRADIALDPFPFNGHTTTCDSVWMGLPVVMLQGDTYASRFGGSVLSNVGLESLLARSIEGYVDIAVSLAHDRQKLARWRGELRARMVTSPLLDFVGFTRNLEDAYRQMWRAWCSSSTVSRG